MASELKSKVRRGTVASLVGALLAVAGWQQAAVAQTAAKTIKVTYAVATRDLNVGYPFATLPLALGYFAEEGLDVDVVPGTSSAATIQLLVSGRAQVGVVVTDPAVVQRAKSGLKVKSFYAVSRRNGFVLVVPEGSPIKTFADLRGKKLGTSDLGSGANVYVDVRLGQAGIPHDAVTQVNVGYGTPAFEALTSGRIDALATFTGARARMEGAGYRFRQLPQAGFEDKMYSYNLYATDEFIAANPEVIEKIGRATAKATVFMKANPEAAVRIFWKQYPERAPKNQNDPKELEKDLAILKAQMHDMKADELPMEFAWGSQDREAWGALQDYLKAAGMVATPKDVGEYFYASRQAGYVKFDRAAVVAKAKAWKP
ncbi:MAG TPA: ABC transporter substrate-binding protein [Ramlibacter sp.]|nr:ABC transporter substrate-binding protein [Ramlibacter sp.]